jgi:hypothetical protein
MALALVGSSAAEASGALQPRLTYRPELPALHPNLARGYELDRSFDADGFTYVDLFNGNLFLSLPIGLRYPLSNAFAYQLMLTYNSKVWDYETVAGKAESRPLAWSNAGLGFDLSLGRLLAPGSPGNPTSQWLYGGFDGSPHLLYSTLHHDVPEPDDPNDDRLYSRDGTYLRLRRVSASLRHLERPDGTVSVFQLQGAEWRLVRQFRLGDEGTDFTITYAPDGSQWTLADAHGRLHVVTFRDDPSGVYPRLVDTVDLEAFGGARAVYTLDYLWTSVPRACEDRRGGEISVPLLAAISDPASRTRAFSYFGAGDCATGGRLRRAQWAAGGHWQWAYRRYDFPPIDCRGGTTAPFLLSETGVASRSTVRPDGTVEGTWKEREDRPYPVPSLVFEREQRYDPAGRLVFASQQETLGSTTHATWSSQTRDARGFLLEQLTFDASAYLTWLRIEFGEHDARGNPRLRTRSGDGTPAGGRPTSTACRGRPSSRGRTRPNPGDDQESDYETTEPAFPPS